MADTWTIFCFRQEQWAAVAPDIDTQIDAFLAEHGIDGGEVDVISHSIAGLWSRPSGLAAEHNADQCKQH